MSTIEIFYMVTVGILLVASIVKNILSDTLIKLYKKEIERLHKSTDGLLEFCLCHIIKDSVEKEDYETADRATKALEELKKISKL